jgi:hypothetical protein
LGLLASVGVQNDDDIAALFTLDVGIHPRIGRRERRRLGWGYDHDGNIRKKEE